MPIDKQSKVSARAIFLRLCVVAVALTVFQIAIAMTFNEQKTPAARYPTLVQWDSVWFAHIVSDGYYVNPNAKNIYYTNTVFPPGFPLFAYVIQSMAGTTEAVSVLLASQIATILFWIYFLLLAKRMCVSRFFTAAGVLCVLLYPASFFFIVGYSDSLFLAMLLGLLYWLGDGKRYSWLIASIHGCIMTSARIVGIPLIILPLVHAVFTKGFQGLRDPRPWLVTAISGAGAGAFFLFCKVAFGEWFIQVRAHQYWATKPVPSAIFNPIFYRHWKPFYADGILHPDYLSLISFQILLSFIIIAVLLELFTLMKRKPSGTSVLRMSLYFTALLTWAFTLTARSHNVSGAFRYMLVPEIMCVLGLMGWSSAMRAKKTLPRIVFWSLVIILFAAIPMQIAYIARYTHRLWVA